MSCARFGRPYNYLVVSNFQGLAEYLPAVDNRTFMPAWNSQFVHTWLDRWPHRGAHTQCKIEQLCETLRVKTNLLSTYTEKENPSFVVLFYKYFNNRALGFCWILAWNCDVATSQNTCEPPHSWEPGSRNLLLGDCGGEGSLSVVYFSGRF